MENQKIDIASKLDLVIPIGAGMSWDNELRYVLRSYDKNVPDLGRVFLVGPKDKLKAKYPWLQNVRIIDCDDPYNHNKDANLIRKVIRAIENGVSEPFIRASDDQFILRKVTDFSPRYIWDIKKKDPMWFRRGANLKYKNRLKRTRTILEINGKTTYNYDGHFPMLYWHDFKRVMENFPHPNRPPLYVKSIGYTINSLYFNNILTEHKFFDNCRAWINAPQTDEKVLKDKLRGKDFLCYSGSRGDVAINGVLKNYIIKKFPKKCRFEK